MKGASEEVCWGKGKHGIGNNNTKRMRQQLTLSKHQPFGRPLRGVDVWSPSELLGLVICHDSIKG